MRKHNWEFRESVADWSDGDDGQSSEHFTCERCGAHYTQVDIWTSGPVVTRGDPPPEFGCTTGSSEAAEAANDASFIASACQDEMGCQD